MVHVANRLKSTAVLAWVAGGAVATLLVAATMVLAPQKAAATPAYGQQTGMACGQCQRESGWRRQAHNIWNELAGEGSQAAGQVSRTTTITSRRMRSS